MIKSTRLAALASAAAVAAALAGCATPNATYGDTSMYPVEQTRTYPPGAYPYGQYPAQQVGYVEFGRVTNVALISNGTQPGYAPNRSATGGVIGAVIGGVIGNQFGHGGERAAATVVGAAAGAAVGSSVARNSGGYNASYPVYRVTVQTDSGAWRTYDVNATGDLRAGDRVRIENGTIYLA